MEIQKFDIEGLLLIQPKIFSDDRGYFFESFNKRQFNSILGYEVNFIQDNESKSSKGVLRGLHFQKPPFSQSKLVRVVAGEVLDVVVDLRQSSPTFGKHQSIRLSSVNKYQFFIPRGFAHGFIVLSDEVIFTYKVDNYYAPSYDSGIIYNDLELEIDWQLPFEQILLSEKDSKLLTFNEYRESPNF